jgi:WD40 repeat protein
MYQGFDVSPDGKVCALSEPVQLDSTRLSAKLVLQSLTSSLVTSAEIASKYGVVHPRFSPDGSKLAAIGYEHGKGAVVLISSAPLYVDFEILREYQEVGPTGFTWSPDSDLLMVSVKSGSTDAATQRWEVVDVKDGATVSVHQPKLPGEEKYVLLPDFQRFVWVR